MRRFLLVSVALLAFATAGLAGSKTTLFLDDTLTHTLVKDRYVVSFGLRCDAWRLEGGKTLMAQQHNAWYEVATRTAETREVTWHGLPVRLTKYVVHTDHEQIRLRFTGGGSFVDGAYVEIVKASPVDAPLYYTLESYSDDDPLANEAGFITDAKDKAVIRAWIEADCPIDEKAWSILGFSQNEAVSAYFACAVVKHSVADLTKMGKYPDLWSNLDELETKHHLDVEVLCEGTAMELDEPTEE